MKIKALRNAETKSLPSSVSVLSKVCARPFAKCSSGHMPTTHVQVRLSTLRYLSKNLRLSAATKRLESAPVAGMPASFSCQTSLFRPTVSERNISAPGGAQYRFGADTANKIKNPASSAGHVRPFVWAASSRAASRTDMLEALFSGVRSS
jgi:hypothetical protein